MTQGSLLRTYHYYSPGKCDTRQNLSRANLSAQDGSRGLKKDIGDEKDEHDDGLGSLLALSFPDEHQDLRSGTQP